MNYLADVKGVKQTEKGTQLIINTEQEVFSKVLHFAETKELNVELVINDPRLITSKQRAKIKATINDIADFLGEARTDLDEALKYNFCVENDIEYFSCGKHHRYRTADITTARLFINYILDFAIYNQIPLKNLGIDRTDDIDHYLLICLRTRTCCITGKKAEIHHVEGSRVGMGRNRKTINHNKLELIALCTELHEQVHRKGEKELFEKYHIYGIEADEKTLKILNINYDEIS